MRTFEQKYTIVEAPPKCISWESYEKIATNEYSDLLKQYSDQENIFQDFFERNPAYIPGPFGLLGESGHYPYPAAVISQPPLNGLCKRVPDFLWLATNSGTFMPVFIEIEAPSKKIFNDNGRPSATFTQALDQLSEWKVLMKQPENIMWFYNFYSIPDYLRERTFSPIFALIYGRRDEFQNDKWLMQKRNELVRDNEILMSFDRININHKARDMICCTVSNGKYYAKRVPPIFKLGPNLASFHSVFHDLNVAFDNMKNTSQERIDFLKGRLEYWINFGKSKDQGIISTGDEE